MNNNTFYLVAFLILASSLCVQIAEAIQDKVLGGAPAGLDEIKYTASLRMRKYDNPFGAGHFCGGTLISYKTVLTAAHCLYGGFILSIQRLLKPKELYVVIGEPIRKARTANSLIFDVEEFYHHTKYQSATIRFDVGVIYLKGEVPYNHPTVRPIPLANERIPDNSFCKVSGWGRTYDKGPLAEVLLSLDVTLINFDTCERIYKPMWGIELRHGMICAAGSNKQNTCKGDSGGPLVCNGKVAGIVSWGVRCGEEGHPGVYTDVYHFKNWIYENDANLNKINCSLQAFTLINILLSIFYYK